jgi:multicomponent Na+:H+ antiporter subunit B
VTRRLRITFFVPALGIFGVLLMWSFVAIPKFGHYRGPYGYVLDRVAVPERHMANVVTSVVFDYRGFDTMGEEFILFVAVMGVVLLLREQERDEPDELADAIDSPGVRIFGALSVTASVVVALWLIANGFITPGGGFQGGAALASSILLVFLVASWRSWAGLANDKVLDPLEGIAASGYVVVGLLALLNGLPFLTNLLGPGRTGTLVSGGSAPIVNWCSGIEVAAALLLLFGEFLQEYLVPMAAKRS